MFAAKLDETEPESATLQFAARIVTNWKQKGLTPKFTSLSPNRLNPVTKAVLDFRTNRGPRDKQRV
jgi:hypothetical protein